MKLKWLLFFTLCALLLPQPTQAFEIADTFFGSNTPHLTLGTVYNPIVQFVYILGGIMVLISFLYAGFKIIQGTPKDLEEGRNIAFGSFAGLVTLISVYWITIIVGTIIGTNPTSGSTGPTPPPIATLGMSVVNTPPDSINTTSYPWTASQYINQTLPKEYDINISTPNYACRINSANIKYKDSSGNYQNITNYPNPPYPANTTTTLTIQVPSPNGRIFLNCNVNGTYKFLYAIDFVE